MVGGRRGAARWIALWALLFGAYAATLGIHAFGDSDYAGDEPHYLLAAESIVSDGDVDLTDEYATREYRDFYPYRLDRHGVPTGGRLHETHGVGFPLLIAPAYALGGARVVELFLAALVALGFLAAVALARRLVPEPWATVGPLVVALSPPALAYSTAVYPDLPAGALLAGAALLALRTRDRPRRVDALGCAALLAPLPWLGTKFALAGGIVLLAHLRWLVRRRQGLTALLSLEVVLASLVAYLTANERLYDGLTPYAAEIPGESATDADFPGGYLERAYRLVALWVDRDYGLLRWAPFVALALVGAWLLWRSRRDRLARALPARLDVEAAASLLLAVAVAQVLVAAFLSPTMFGFWFPGRHLVAALPVAAALSAWGLRHAPRSGAALGVLTVVASVWLYASVRTGDGGWVAPGSSAPWGPLEALLPLYGTDSAWPGAVVAAAVVAAGLLVGREWRQRRHVAAAARSASPA